MQTTDNEEVFDYFLKFKKQKYDKLKSDLLSKKKLFVDEQFPANDSSLFKTKTKNGIVWKRPHVILGAFSKNYETRIISLNFKEICQDPKLVVGDVTSRDVNQGQVGNCW